jgi:membrane-bound metal-dependent hydrolase YbcI (DUF457 family)
LDNLTHSLFALTLSRTSLSRAGRGTTAALLLASNAPDIDIVATAGGSVNYLAWHRGVTHGPLGVVGLALVTAGLVWIGRRYSDRPGAIAGTRGAAATVGPEHDASFAMLAAVAMIGVLLHVLMDLPTSYGIRLLSPFSWRWFAVDWMPIVDLYLLIMFVAGMVFGRGSDAARRRNAVIVLTLMTANYGIRGVAHHEALVLAPQLFGPTMPTRCGPDESRLSPIDSWPRPLPAATTTPARTRCLVELAALPAFTSPFEWRIVAQMSNAFEVHDLDLLDPRFRAQASGTQVPWRLTVRYPNVWTSAVERAATTHLGQVFLGFSRFPAARSVVDQKGVTTVRWTDIRFTSGPMAPSQSLRPVNMFTATIRIGPDSRILQETLGR